MSNYSKIYWLTRLDSLHNALGIIEVLLLIAVIVIIVATTLDASFDEFERGNSLKEKKSSRKNIRWHIRWMVPLGVFLLLFQSFIPTKNEALLIVAGGKTMDYIQADSSLSKIPYQTTALISNFLDKQLRGLKEEKSPK